MNVWLLLVFALGTGLVTDLFFFALGDVNEGDLSPNRIFSKQGAYILRKFNERRSAIIAEEERHRRYHIANMLSKHNVLSVDELPDEALEPPIYQPVNWWKLLACPRCFNVWATLATFIALTFALGLSGWWFLALIPYIGFSGLGLAIAQQLRKSS